MNRVSVTQSSALLLVLLAYAGISQAAPITLNVWNSPSQTVGNTNYLDSDTLALQLSLASVRVLADADINVLEDIDVSTSVFGTAAGNLALRAPDVNLLGDIIMGTGQFAVESINFSLQDATVFTPVAWNLPGSFSAGAGGQLHVGSNSFLQLVGGTLGANVLVDADATLELVGYGFQLDTGSGFGAAGFGALNSNSGTLKGFLTSGQAFEFDFSHDAALSDIVLTAVPVPAAVWLFGSALAGLGWLRRKQTA